MAVTTEPIMINIQDLEIIDEEAKRRSDFDIYAKEHRSDLIRLRKDILHEIIGRCKYAKKK